jgi:hypothetical protein
MDPDLDPKRRQSIDKTVAIPIKTKCQISRYRIDKVSKKVPHKVLHYIPIIPCFQWLFKCQSIAQFMDFHAKNISQDDVLQMPADGSALKYIEEKWPIFKE